MIWWSPSGLGAGDLKAPQGNSSPSPRHSCPTRGFGGSDHLQASFSYPSVKPAFETFPWTIRRESISEMMRNKTSSAMQKTYDECYLTCSTAVYFEAQVGIQAFLLAFPFLVTDTHNFHRIMNMKHFVPGVVLSITSTTSMLTRSHQTFSQRRRRRKPYKNP